MAYAIAAGAPGSWQRISLPGEFDFSDDALKHSLRFDVGALLVFDWEQTATPHRLSPPGCPIASQLL